MRSATSALLDRQRERAPARDDCGVELCGVLLGVVVLERACVRVAQLREPVRRRLDRELVVAVELLRLVAFGRVVALERSVDVVEQIMVVLLEEGELPRDQIAKALTAEDHTSSS